MTAGTIMTEADFHSLQAVGALVVVLDADDRIVYWNRACSELTGYSAEEVGGRRLWDFLLVPEEVEPVRSALAAARTADAPSRFANYWVTRRGERRWIVWSNTMARGPDGRRRYCIETGIDHSESKAAEDRLAGIIGIAADAIVSADDDQRITMYNQAAEAIFGWSAAEVMGKPLDLLIPERFRHRHGQHVRAFAAGEQTARRMGERMPAIFGVRKNGEEFPAQAAISKLELGGKGMFIVVLRDVTQERRRDRERELLAAVAAAFADTLDADDTLTRLVGLLVRELADLCIVDLIDRDGKLRRKKVAHRDAGRTALCEALQRFPAEGERALVFVDVTQLHRPVCISDLPLNDLTLIAHDDEQLRVLRDLAPRSIMVLPLVAHGRALGTLALVSSQPARRYEEADLWLAEEIARRTAIAIENVRLYEDAWEATHDLREANQQMVVATIRAQEATEEAEAAKTRAEQSERELRELAEFREMFIGIVGHDLRNPLGAIGMSAKSLLRSDRLDPQDEKKVRRIIGSQERMAKMISQLLDFTRARLGGGFTLEPRPSDLRQVCSSVVDEFDAPIRLEVDGDVTGTWDPDRVAEALSNIAGNAVDHAAPGTAVVVRAHGEDEEVVVEVINQGEPIPADVLPFIFEPFRRAKQHEKSSSSGHLGLGLYIANQIVRSGHGSLAAYSVDGTTTFLMRLPRHALAVAAAEDPAALATGRRDDRFDAGAGQRRHSP